MPDSSLPESPTTPHVDEDKEDAESLLNELEEDLDDLGAIKRRYMSSIVDRDDGEFNSSQVPVDTISRREVQNLLDNLPKPLAQKPFQPGSSPNDEDNRFLCWNNYGIIRAQYTKDDQSIDVMFHDSEKHASINFRNDPNYTLGSMSDDAIVVGSNGKYGTGPASIHGIDLLESNRDQREWEVELPHVELIEALAVGRGFVAIVTDHRNLRLFTNGGMQSYVFTLPGQILCMTAHEKQLMMVMHDGAGLNDEQNLTMVVYYIDILNNEITQMFSNIPVALSKRSPLAWIGLTDEGTPCTYDYSGVLRMYHHSLGKSWVPLLDLRELTSSALDHYFVVGVSEIGQTIRAVKCKRSRFPEFTESTAEILNLSLPLCEMDTDKGKLEEEHVRLRLAEISYKRLTRYQSVEHLAESANEANEKLLVNTILRLFAMYLKDDKEELAKSLVYMMPKDHMSKLPEFAWKTNRRQYFIDSLNRAIDEREQSELDVKRGIDDDILSVTSSAHNFGKDLNHEIRKSKPQPDVEASLKPIGIETLTTTTRLVDTNCKVKLGSLTNKDDKLDESEDEENIAKVANKRTKSVNYNLFSKKRPKVTN